MRSGQQIRTSHLYLYDSTVGQRDLARENNVHVKLIMKAKSVVNTTSPKFWIPHVGSPLRLTRPHSASAARPLAPPAAAAVMSGSNAMHQGEQGISYHQQEPGKIRPQSAGMARSGQDQQQQQRPTSAAGVVRGTQPGFRIGPAAGPTLSSGGGRRPRSAAANKRLPLHGAQNASEGRGGANKLPTNNNSTSSYGAGDYYNLHQAEQQQQQLSQGGLPSPQAVPLHQHNSSSSLVGEYRGGVNSGDAAGGGRQEDGGGDAEEGGPGPVGVYGAEAAAVLRHASDGDVPHLSGTLGPDGGGGGQQTAPGSSAAPASGLSPFRDHGLTPTPAATRTRRRSPHSGGSPTSRSRQRQNYQQMALQRALDKQALEEQQRREQFREEQTRGLTLMGAAAVARAEGVGRVAPPSTNKDSLSQRNNSNSSIGLDPHNHHLHPISHENSTLSMSVPVEYGGGLNAPPQRKGGGSGLPQQHLTYHVEEVFHAQQAAVSSSPGGAPLSPHDIQNSSIQGSLAATSQVRASELAAMRGHGAAGAAGGPNHVQDMVEEFIHFCSTAFPADLEGDDEVRRLLMHCNREIEERRLLALHRQRQQH